MTHRRFEAILFDLGSTLIYFDAKWPEILLQADAELMRSLQAAGLLRNAQDFSQKFRTRVEEYYLQRETEFIEYTTAFILRSLLEELGYTNVPDDSWRRPFYAVTQTHWLVGPGVPTLERLREEVHWLISMRLTTKTYGLCDKAGLRTYFSDLDRQPLKDRKPNRASSTRRSKTDVRPVRLPWWRTWADILGAQNAGLYAIWGRATPTRLLTRPLDTISRMCHQSLSELPGLLGRLEDGEQRLEN
jgi:FMN phosphatase YigB (HAD superfamily)